jgi:hypothetical protein
MAIVSVHDMTFWVKYRVDLECGKSNLEYLTLGLITLEDYKIDYLIGPNRLTSYVVDFLSLTYTLILS